MAAWTPGPGEVQNAAGGPERRQIEFRWREHPSLRLARGTHVDLTMRLQGDARASQAALANGSTSDWAFARRRLGVEGEIANVVEFQVEREFGDAADPWRDVHATFTRLEALQVRTGKFKLPFSADENRSAADLDFVLRSRAATELAPGRDRGVMMFGGLLSRRIRYELGVFAHDGRNARASDPTRVVGGTTQAGRVRLRPFRGASGIVEHVSVGVALTLSDLTAGWPGLRGTTPLAGEFYSADVWVRGRRQRFGVEGQWEPGPCSLRAEYIRLSDERRGQSVQDADLSPLVATGWYVSGTWALTGGRKAEGLDRPAHPVERGGPGAIELAVRVERLSFSSTASGEPPSTSPRADVVAGNGDRVVTAGVNWYANRWFKIQFNLIRDAITAPERGPYPSRPAFWSRVLRLQVSL